MKFLWINRGRNQPEIRTKTYYSGGVVDNEPLSKRKNILITGAHHSGKTKMLRKLYDEAEAIWRNQVKPYRWTGNKGALAQDKPMLAPGQDLGDWTFPEPVFLSGMNPVSQWVAHDGVASWWEEANPETPYKKVPAWKKPELLPLYLKETRAILFIDDAHKLSGRKLQIAKACAGNAFRTVITADDENRIPPSLRVPMLDSNPQIVRLTTDTAYDATHAVMLLLLTAFVLMGMTEAAMIIGGLHFLSGGRRAGKQD